MGILARLGLVHAEPRELKRSDAPGWKEEAGNWKRKAEEARRALEDARADVVRHSTRAEELEKELHRTTEQHAKQLADVSTMEVRLLEAERDLRVTRDHLMVVETKLDILEGAANVLDARFRSTMLLPTPQEGPERS